MFYVFYPRCTAPYTSMHFDEACSCSQFLTRRAAALNHSQSLDRRMCSGAVRAAVTSVFDNEDFCLGAPRMILVQESAKVILAHVDTNENSREAFDKFAVVVMDKMNSAAVVSANAKNFSSQREMMWSKFRQIRNSELPKLWNEL